MGVGSYKKVLTFLLNTEIKSSRMELPRILLGGMENLLWWFSLGLIIICVHEFLGEKKKVFASFDIRQR